jgi:hypothetical protein
VIFVAVLAAALLIAFIVRMMILRRNRRNTMKAIKELVIRAASDSEA